MNLSFLPSALDFLRKGGALTEPGLWKVRGEKLKFALGAAILALNPVVKGLTGHDLGITPEVSGGIAAAAVWLLGLFFTAATSDKVGLPAKPAERPAPVAGPSGDQPAQRNEPAATPVGSEQPDPMRNWSASDLQAP